ncbi:hypothetical protein [Lysinibacillus sphaericus]|uniref:hypothetical protein n=1 Tax=Lysinibacillus sphaericus TaxID=1421 RepID=UPI0018CFAAF6|nr:hypothetical protein [Lysinibacillus sphaericus]MBG9479383.1 hypothetical protein [Lysinibacillus sphaericus]MBG9479432.1 hypothetical protein [Lysinibacillus sphaericus]
MSEQLCLFDIRNLHNEIKIGDPVKIILPAASVCSETHYYLKYYYPQVINKIGQVINVITGGFEVNVQGFLITLAPCAIQRNHI